LATGTAFTNRKSAGAWNAGERTGDVGTTSRAFRCVTGVSEEHDLVPCGSVDLVAGRSKVSTIRSAGDTFVLDTCGLLPTRVAYYRPPKAYVFVCPLIYETSII
jgi:hypothetical protein